MTEFWDGAMHAFEMWISSNTDYLCAYCHIQFPSDALLFRHVETVKRQTGINLNLWGVNPLEVTHFKAGH